MHFIFRQLIYNYPEQLFGAAGVMAIEHADFAGVERLALVTGTGKRISNKYNSHLGLLSATVFNSLLRYKAVSLKKLESINRYSEI
jgi:hypothetical protein